MPKIREEIGEEVKNYEQLKQLAFETTKFVEKKDRVRFESVSLSLPSPSIESVSHWSITLNYRVLTYTGNEKIYGEV